MDKTSTVDQLTQRNVEIVAQMEKASIEQRTPGERVADGFASLLGSWRFIIIQSIVLAFWMTLNVIGWVKHWDPYPFVLLNLALSFQSAYTGPILLMSQNRQNRITERRSHLDLQINLLSEQENTEMLHLLRLLCEKNGIDLPRDPKVAVLEQTTEPTVLLDQITKAVEGEEPDGKEAESP